MVIVPQLGGNKYVFALYKAFIDRTPDALASFFFVLIVISAIKQAIANLDGLELISQSAAEVTPAGR